MKQVICILAAALSADMTSYVIGESSTNSIPWTCKRDMKHFRETTKGTDPSETPTVIMGRTTWLSLPEKHRVLAGRKTAVISATIDEATKSSWPEVKFYGSLQSAIDDAASSKIFVAGGVSLYIEALQHALCKVVYLTTISSKVPIVGDVKLPSDAFDAFTVAVEEEGVEGDIEYAICRLER